jgi:hypothetical protein
LKFLKEKQNLLFKGLMLIRKFVLFQTCNSCKSNVACTSDCRSGIWESDISRRWPPIQEERRWMKVKLKSPLVNKEIYYLLNVFV